MNNIINNQINCSIMNNGMNNLMNQMNNFMNMGNLFNLNENVDPMPEIKNKMLQVIFEGNNLGRINVCVDKNNTINELINSYLLKIGKNDLINNYEKKFSFFYNGKNLLAQKNKKIGEFFKTLSSWVIVTVV